MHTYNRNWVYNIRFWFIDCVAWIHASHMWIEKWKLVKHVTKRNMVNTKTRAPERDKARNEAGGGNKETDVAWTHSRKENLLTISRVANAITTCGYSIVAFIQILFTSLGFICSYKILLFLVVVLLLLLFIQKQVVVREKVWIGFTPPLLFIAFDACFVVAHSA